MSLTESALELAERALGHSSGEMQVTVIRERSVLSRFARSTPTQATEVDDLTVHFLGVARGATASATTNATSDAGLRDGARRAQEALRVTVSRGGGDYPGLPAPTPVRAHSGHDLATAALDVQEASGALVQAFAGAGSRDLEAFGAWTVGEVVTAIASSAGVRASDAVTDAHMKVTCRDRRGRSGSAAATAVRASDLDPGALTRRAAEKVTSEELTDLAPGRYPVVLDAEAVGSLLDFLGGLGFNGLAHAERRGALCGRLGTRVAAAGVSLSDSPRSAATLPRAFDAEGVPKGPITLIEDGVAVHVVHDSRSARRAGGAAQSTGHALEPGGAADGPAPTNLVLTGGGAADVEELAAPISRGLYVTRLWYVNPVSEREVLLTGMTRDGTFLIEEGRITRPVRDVRFTDSVLRILAATEALGAQVRLVSDGDYYGRRFARGVVCPALRATGFRVTGAKPG